MQSITGKLKLTIVGVLLSLFCLQSLAGIVNSSATFDEVQYFGLGKYLLQHRKWDVMGSIVHPPLVFYLTGIPMLLVNEDKHLWEYEEKKRDINFLGAVDVVRGQGFLSAPANSGDRLLISSRLMILLLGLLLGYYIYRFTYELFGARSALLALFVYTFCPNMIAFSGLGTQDLPLAALLFISCYHFWRFLGNESGGSATRAGLFLGLALATKLTAFLLLPFEIGFYAAYCHARSRRPTVRFVWIMVMALLVLCLSYGFNPTPFFQTIELTGQEMQRGQAGFLHGALANTSWWYFYPVVLLIKTPLPILVLFAASLFYGCRKIRNKRFNLLYILVPPVALFMACSTSNYAVGIRYLLPIFPFMYVMIGSLAQEGRRVRWLAGFMAVWLAGGTLFVAPHYLAYFNESIGGPANGYKYLVDSNLDWGQGLKELKRYMDAHGVKRVSLSYFGTDSPQRYGIEYDWLPSHYLYNPAPDKPAVVPQNQLLAISATNLQGVYLQNRDEFKLLREREPIAEIGYSILLYDLSGRSGERR